VNAALQNALRTTAVLLVFAIGGTALLASTFFATRPAISRSEQEAQLHFIRQVLPPGAFDNDILNDVRTLPPDPLLGTRRPASAWIARKQGRPTAVVLEAIAPDGYSGEIGLVIGIDANGVITGVRVTRHTETPGLGDYIDIAKSNWIEQFRGKSLSAPPELKWRVKKDGGAFDSVAGATITPRAVVKAVKSALDYFARHQADLLAPAAKAHP
jgi:electron transport complex protein RnfG